MSSCYKKGNLNYVIICIIQKIYRSIAFATTHSYMILLHLQTNVIPSTLIELF